MRLSTGAGLASSLLFSSAQGVISQTGQASEKVSTPLPKQKTDVYIPLQYLCILLFKEFVPFKIPHEF